MIFFQKIIEYINFFPTEDYSGVCLFISLFTESVEGTAISFPPRPFSLSGMKPAKRWSKLESDNDLALGGRENSFASLWQAGARGFTCVFLQEQGTAHPPARPQRLSVGARAPAASPSAAKASWKPLACF